MNTKVINKSDICSALNLKGSFGNILSSVIMSLMGFNKINRLYASSCELKGGAFTESILNSFEISYTIDSADLSNIPETGPFIILSNHPFGGADGIILYDIISKKRPDLKVMANFILSLIANLKECFIPVNPFSDKGLRTSLPGIRSAIEHINQGHCLAVFPAGEVSTYHNNKYTEDIPWQSSIIKMVKNSGVPVIPFYFDGTNSKLFHFAGRIHPFLRTLLLPRELLKRRGKNVKLVIGKPITVSEINSFSSTSVLGSYLRNRTYALEALLDNSHIDGNEFVSNVLPIDPPKETSLLVDELKGRESDILFRVSDYTCYLLDYCSIPNIMHELGRRREEAFRAVGEGTGHSIDTDEFDPHYKHLILWSSADNTIVGAYRLGIGKDLIREKGSTGFYTNSLFKFNEHAKEILEQSIELGRSFVSIEYQKDNLALMLLIKGLLFSVMKYPDCKYLIGPVSISNWYPSFYQSLMIYYLEKKHLAKEFRHIVSPRSPFHMDYLRVDPNLLLADKVGNVETFDRFLLRLSNNRYRMPTLLKKYLKLNTRVLCYNIDKNFNYCVDALIILNVLDVPEKEIISLSKECDNNAEIMKRFGCSTFLQ